MDPMQLIPGSAPKLPRSYEDEAARLVALLEGQLADSPSREREALERIAGTVRRARRSMRLARPTPREGVEAALDLIGALAEGGLR